MMVGFTAKVIAQTNDYTVNWSDTSTYKVNCGNVVPAKWSVKNESCEMTTPHLRAEAAEGCKVFFNFSVNQSGNGEISDLCHIYHQIDKGEWVLDTIITGGAGTPSVRSISDSVYIDYEHFVQFKIRMSTNSQTEFWSILSGDMQASDGDINANKLSLWSGEPPPLPTMPVELLMFNGIAADGTVELNWATASETNNDYYTVARSVDGITYENIATVNGAGNSNNTLDYYFKDTDPIHGINYYRLIQVDFDGKVNDIGNTWCNLYTNIIQDSPIISYSDEIINISINSLEDQSIRISVYDLNGHLLLSENIELIKGINQNSIKASCASKGLYVVKVDTTGKSYCNKLNIL